MDLKKRKKKENSILDRYTVPVPERLKADLDKLKSEEYEIDVNAMAREFFEILVSQTLRQDQAQQA